MNRMAHTQPCRRHTAPIAASVEQPGGFLRWSVLQGPAPATRGLPEFQTPRNPFYGLRIQYVGDDPHLAATAFALFDVDGKDALAATSRQSTGADCKPRQLRHRAWRSSKLATAFWGALQAIELRRQRTTEHGLGKSASVVRRRARWIPRLVSGECVQYVVWR